MWKNFLKWLLKFALEQLGADVDAESQKQLDDYNLKRKEVELRRVESEKELERIEQEKFALNAKRARNSLEIEALLDEIKQQEEVLRGLNEENEQKISDIRNSDDDTILHGALHGAN